MTPYAKTPQTNEDIAAILESRGLAFDKDQLLAFLAKVGYYRLKGYLVPFRQPDKVDFAEGADFATVKAIYDFDANLRTVSGMGLAIVEVAVRAAITRYHLAWKPDPFLRLSSVAWASPPTGRRSRSGSSHTASTSSASWRSSDLTIASVSRHPTHGDSLIFRLSAFRCSG